MTIAYILSFVSGLYGLAWVIFTFVDPPGFISYLFRAPGIAWWLPEWATKLVIGLFFMIAVPLLSTFIVTMFFR